MVGSPATVRAALDAFVDQTRPNEIIVSAQIYDHGARLRSYEIVASL
jgi:pyrimidine operon attenuation protein/uracil phosphoribosyltransferase